ncbi:MAG: hypothetical protein ACLSCO_12680 [Gallintestinimicrobium sp.]
MYKFTMPADKWDETAPDKQAIRLLIMKHQKFREKLAKRKSIMKASIRYWMKRSAK